MSIFQPGDMQPTYASNTTLQSTSSESQPSAEPVELPYGWAAIQNQTITADIILDRLNRNTTQLDNMSQTTFDIIKMVDDVSQRIPPIVVCYEIISKDRFKSIYKVWGIGLHYVLALGVSTSFLNSAYGWADPQLVGVVHNMVPAVIDAINTFKVAHAVHVRKYGSLSLESGMFLILPSILMLTYVFE